MIYLILFFLVQALKKQLQEIKERVAVEEEEEEWEEEEERRHDEGGSRSMFSIFMQTTNASVPKRFPFSGTSTLNGLFAIFL